MPILDAHIAAGTREHGQELPRKGGVGRVVFSLACRVPEALAGPRREGHVRARGARPALGDARRHVRHADPRAGGVSGAVGAEAGGGSSAAEADARFEPRPARAADGRRPLDEHAERFVFAAARGAQCLVAAREPRALGGGQHGGRRKGDVGAPIALPASVDARLVVDHLPRASRVPLAIRRSCSGG
eukprot:6074263-Prymnesium_polylepis.1